MIVNLLSTPIYAEKIFIKNREEVLKEVRHFIGSAATYNGYYTHNQLHRLPLFGPLCEAVTAQAKAYLGLLGHQTRDGSPWGLAFSRMWATQFSHENAVQVHQHGGQGGVMSGVFYLELPPDTASGIKFHPTNVPFLEKIPFKTDFSDIVEVEEGTLLLFPSETLHSGVPNKTDQKRINISFDIVYFDNLYGPILL